MKPVCKAHPHDPIIVDLAQADPDTPTYVSIFCGTCKSLLWQCISHVIASTAFTQQGRIE